MGENKDKTFYTLLHITTMINCRTSAITKGDILQFKSETITIVPNVPPKHQPIYHTDIVKQLQKSGKKTHPSNSSLS